MSSPAAQPFTPALEVDAREDLAPLVELLRAARVPHRCHERVGRQVVLVPGPYVERVRELRGLLARGEVDTVALRERLRAGVPPGPRADALDRLRRAPATAVLLLLALLVFAATLGSFRSPAALWLLWVPEVQLLEYLMGGPALPAFLAPFTSGQLWRVLTPALLHDGPVHLIGNAVMLFWFGTRIEPVEGTGRFVVLVLATAAVGDAVQFLWAGAPFFGGLSGVVYGLLGFLLAVERTSGVRYGSHPGLHGMMLVFLVAATTGMFAPFGLHVGNGAHWGGFLAGAALGLARGRVHGATTP
jgi:GlpG protein